MAQQSQAYVTQEQLDATLEYVIDLLGTIKAAVRGATYLEGRVVFPTSRTALERLTLSVGGRPGCACQREGQTAS